MKLYVWEGVLSDYTSGMMIAYADSVEEARELLLKECFYIPKNDLNQEPLVVENKAAFYVWGGG